MLAPQSSSTKGTLAHISDSYHPGLYLAMTYSRSAVNASWRHPQDNKCLTLLSQGLSASHPTATTNWARGLSVQFNHNPFQQWLTCLAGRHLQLPPTELKDSQSVQSICVPSLKVEVLGSCPLTRSPLPEFPAEALKESTFSPKGSCTLVQYKHLS